MKVKKTRQITDLDIKRIAFVDHAANKREYLLFKRDGSEDELDQEGNMTEAERLAKEKEDLLRSRNPEDSLPEEVVGAGLPVAAKRAIVASLKDMNNAVTSLAKLLGYGFEEVKEEKVEEVASTPPVETGDVNQELNEAKARITELETALGEATETIDGLKDSIVTTEDVQGMLSDSNQKESE